MPLSIFAAVLVGAALHASWNAIVKGGPDSCSPRCWSPPPRASSPSRSCPSCRFRPRQLAVHRRLGGGPGALLRAGRRRLQRDRHEPRLSADARPRPRARRPLRRRLPRRAPRAAAWAGVALISGGVFGMTFAFRGPALPRRHAARAAERRRHRHLHADRRHRRPPLRRAGRLRHVALPAQRRPARRLGAPHPPPRARSPTPPATGAPASSAASATSAPTASRSGR